jgi:hypothetical protein
MLSFEQEGSLRTYYFNHPQLLFGRITIVKIFELDEGEHRCLIEKSTLNMLLVCTPFVESLFA